MWRHSYIVSAYIATLPYLTLSCPILSCHVRYFLRVPVKITVRVLAAGCQLTYRKFYGFFYSVYLKVSIQSYHPRLKTFSLAGPVIAPLSYNFQNIICSSSYLYRDFDWTLIINKTPLTGKSTDFFLGPEFRFSAISAL